MTDPEELERQAKAAMEKMKDPDPWTKEQQETQFDNLLENIMTILFTAVVSGILLAVLLS
jgi:hypothetical protein